MVSTLILAKVSATIGTFLIMWWLVVVLEWWVPTSVKSKGRKALETLKTGDLIFFTGMSWPEKSIRAYTGNLYNHVGLLVVDPSSPEKYFVLESDVTAGYRKGPRLIPLTKKLETWRGPREYGYLEIKNPIKTMDTLDFIMTRQDHSFDYQMWSWAFSGSWWKDVTRKDQAYFCSEFIAEFLMKLWMLPRGDPTNYAPKDLWNLGGGLYYHPHQVYSSFS